VTETFDWSGSKAGRYVELVRWPAKNRAAIHDTLARLEAFVENTSSPL
jgi:hypothetical protein